MIILYFSFSLNVLFVCTFLDLCWRNAICLKDSPLHTVRRWFVPFFLESWDGTVEGDDLLKKQDEAEKRLDEYLVDGKAETVKIHSILPERRKSENPHFKAKAMQQSPLDIVLKKGGGSWFLCWTSHLLLFLCQWNYSHFHLRLLIFQRHFSLMFKFMVL